VRHYSHLAARAKHHGRKFMPRSFQYQLPDLHQVCSGSLARRCPHKLSPQHPSRSGWHAGRHAALCSHNPEQGGAMSSVDKASLQEGNGIHPSTRGSPGADEGAPAEIPLPQSTAGGELRCANCFEWLPILPCTPLLWLVHEWIMA
jgi:hypothetical protein